jgi:hypothetical protein
VNSAGPFFNFKNACKVHDYAYDLMRFYRKAGVVVRGTADGFFYFLMRQSCSGKLIGGGTCNAVAGVYYNAVAAASAYKRWGVPS